MQMQWKKSITYARFWDRLQRWWQLKTAIETPCVYMRKKETSKGTNPRRKFIIKSTYDEDTVKTQNTLDELITMNRIKMPKPKPTLWQRIKKLFKK